MKGCAEQNFSHQNRKKKKSELRVNDGGYTLCVCLLQVREVFKQIARVKRTEGEMLRLLILDSI